MGVIAWLFRQIRVFSTGKSLSEALVLASTNPNYDARLFIELQVQYKKKHVKQVNKVHKLVIYLF